MTRRKLVALVSAAVLLTLGLAAVVGVLFVTRTTTGRAKLLGIAKPFLANKVVKNGSLYIGAISGNLLTSLTIDSIAIRDKRGELFLSTGRITVWYNPRDLMDYRVYIRRADVEHPYVHLIRHENDVWNFQEIFASNTPEPKKPKETTTRGWGDYVVFDSVAARNASFFLTLAWHPDTALRGAKRDSVIRVHLKDPHKAVARTFDGFGRTYAWTNGHGLITHARISDPDSNQFGQEFHVEKLGANEFEPTFTYQNITAQARRLGDSVWFQVPHFDMPASTGHGQGKVWWGHGPVRYDVAIRGDSVSLNDVNWVYPTLPRTGGGSLDLTIKNDPKDLEIVNFKLAKMDVRSTKSHLTGTMSFGTGAPLLLVRDVDIVAQPVNFDLLRTLGGKPFPQDWQGDLNGTVKARGGPLTHFYVDDARGTFTDFHVRGAVSRFAGKGELDILEPANTTFHGFNVDVGSLDLRTVEYLFPAFPPLHGFASGTATLDSSYLDVRFSNAHIALQDGPGEPTRLSGSGRITDGVPFMTYDVTLDAQPLNVTMLARSPHYAWLPFRGLVNGPIRAKGTSPDLELSTSLQGSVGAFSFDGHVDLDSIGGMGARGHGQFSAINLATLLEKSTIPEGLLSGHYEVDVTGETAASLRGMASVDIERTLVDSIRVYPSHASVRFADGRMTIDSLHVHTAAATLSAAGGIGLPGGRADSLRFTVTMDSLGGLRRFLPPPDTSRLGAAATPPDSLSGNAKIIGVLAGTFDALNVSGRLAGNDLVMNNERGDDLAATFAIHDLTNRPNGVLFATLDTAVLAGIALDSLTLQVHMDNTSRARFSLAAASRNGPSAAARGEMTTTSNGQSIAVDSLGILVGDALWRLASPAHLALTTHAVSLDSLVLRNRDSASVVLSATVPDTGQVFAEAHATHLPLKDIGTLFQLNAPLVGTGDLNASVSGTMRAPHIAARGVLSGIDYHGVNVDRVVADANYANTRLNVGVNVQRNGKTAVEGDAILPIDVHMFGYEWRNEAMTGHLTADTTDLTLVRALGAPLDSVHGKLWTKLELSGTPRAPAFGGTLLVIDGSALVSPLGVEVRGINGRVFAARNAQGQDSIDVRATALNSADSELPGQISLNGWIKNLFQTNPAKNATQSFDFKMGARTFHAFDKRSAADLYVSTTDSLRLRGTTLAAALTGAIVVDRGSIFIADRDIARKRAVDLLSDESTATGGMSVSGSTFITTLKTNLSPNVTITMGNDVRLRSREANVKLAGSLQLGTSTDRSTRTLASGELVPLFSLEGTLRTVSGSYTLPLGPVQREFTVMSDGTVTFAGAADNPTLDIRAVYNVRRPGDRDLGVIVKLQGPLLPYPTISFGSTADYDIATSDLVSYLLVGRPGFDFGASGQTIAQVLAPTLSAVAADQLRSSLGSWLDVFQFQLGTGATTQDANSTFLSGANLRNYLYTSTVGVERQFGNAYLGVNTGLCQFNPEFTNTGGRFSALNGVGASLGYRFDPRLSLQLSWDPPTANRICSQSYNNVGLVPTPGQASFSLSHTWRF